MRTNTIVAVVLIALGVVTLVYHGITYTTQEKVVDFGPLKVTTETTKTLPLPPILGTVAIVGGVVLLIMGRRKG